MSSSYAMADKSGKDPKAAPTAATTPSAATSPQAPSQETLKEQVEALKQGFTISFAQPTIASSFTPDNIFKFFTGEITQAELLGFSPEDAHAFASFAYQQFQQGRYHDAQRIFAGLVTLNPGDSYNHTMLGACMQMLDNREGALIEYSTAVDLDDNNMQARVNRADLYLQTGKFEEALKDLRRVVDSDAEGKSPASMRARALAAATANALAQFIDMMKKQGK